MGERYLAQLVGPIKRVVRKDGDFICGICQESYRAWPEALSCLRDCWQSFHALPTVVMRQRRLDQNTHVYRCRYCARDYTSLNEAKACGKNCLALSLHQFNVEWALLGYIPPLAKKPRREKTQITPTFKIKAPKKNKKNSVEELRDPDESGPIADAPVSQALTSEMPPVSADEKEVVKDELNTSSAEEDTKAKKEKDYGFYREGARYVCDVCNTKYFTKDDVMKCFKSHS